MSRGRAPRGGAGGRPQVAAPAAGRTAPGAAALAEAILWLLVLAVPVVFVPTARDSFRLPKLLVGEWLGLASLVPLAFALRNPRSLEPRRLWRLSAVRAVVPILAVASLGLATTLHPVVVRSALADLWIGALLLVVWSAALPAGRLRRLLAGILVPASLLAVLAALQFHGVFRPFEFAPGEGVGRFGVTALAGNTGDLGAYLALACVVGQALVARAVGRRARQGSWPGSVGGIVWPAVAAGVCLYGTLLTQTLAAVAAVVAGSAILWWRLLRRRRRALAVAAGAVALLAVLALAVGPVRSRAVGKLAALRGGHVNQVLSGRLDGWRAALWMLRRQPLTGVGQGAYGSEFPTAKLELMDRGVHFFGEYQYAIFGNAHDEPLEAAAEWGLPGLAALGWALFVLGGCLLRMERAAAAGGAAAADRWEAALGWGFVTALGVLSLAHFPLRIGLTAFPALLAVAWILRHGDRAAAAPPDPPPGRRSRLLPLVAGVLALTALGVQTDRAADRLRASRIQRTVEEVTKMALAQGSVPPALLWTHVRLLEQASALDPTAQGVVQAEGVQYLLLGRLDRAETVLRRALALEPRPETYLNLGRVLAAGGRRAEAIDSFTAAVRLDPQLAPQVPAEARSQAKPRHRHRRRRGRR